MELRDFLKGEAIGTPEEEIDVRLVLAENAALKDENAELRERLAYLEKLYTARKVKRLKSFLKVRNRFPCSMNMRCLMKRNRSLT